MKRTCKIKRHDYLPTFTNKEENSDCQGNLKMKATEFLLKRWYKHSMNIKKKKSHGLMETFFYSNKRPTKEEKKITSFPSL